MMNIIYYKEFVALSKSESFEKAAEELYTTQSTLSKHIKKMEAELGVTLFERTTRHVKTSEYGKLLLPHALQIQNIEQQIQNLERQIQNIEQRYLSELPDYSRALTKKIKIGAVDNILAYKIADIFFEFQQRYPHPIIDISGGSPYEVYQQLITKQIDLAFLRYYEKMDMSNFTIMPFAEDEIVVVCSRTHKLASKNVVSLSELRDETILLSTKKSFKYDFVMDACANAGFKPKVALTGQRTESLIDLAAHDMGICFIMKQQANICTNPNVAIIDIIPPYKCKIDLCSNKTSKLSASAEKFWSYATLVASRINEAKLQGVDNKAN